MVTGSRAEFGLLRWVMQDITDRSDLSLQVIVTGMHLSPLYGNTYQEVTDAGFSIDYCVEMLLGSDSRSAVAKSTGIGTMGFADAYERLRPDIIVVLGDRFEILAAVTAALFHQIPVAHLHGGEVTTGAFDDPIRHAITKLSHLHFAATTTYRDRIIQMGECPDRVFLVGGLGVDAAKRVTLMPQDELEQSLGFAFGDSCLLVTFHPATLDGDSVMQMQALLDALDCFKDIRLIFTMPNSDPQGSRLRAMVKEYVASREGAMVMDSLGHLRYVSCLQFVAGVVGNSSSGLLEAPSFGVGSVDIGNRQFGRLSAASVIRCSAETTAITGAIAQMLSEEFRDRLADVKNPYGEGGASLKVVDILQRVSLSGLAKKIFFDVPLADVLKHPLLTESEGSAE